MENIAIISQVIVALGIFNVWLIRSKYSTHFRGGDAKTLREEFDTYQLPMWFMQLVRFLKLLFAALLFAGVWVPSLVKPAAIGLAMLMLGAVAMHLKVKDPIVKSVPALSVLGLLLIVIGV